MLWKKYRFLKANMYDLKIPIKENLTCTQILYLGNYIPYNVPLNLVFVKVVPEF